MRGAFVAATLAAVGIVGIVAVWGVGTAGAQGAPATLGALGEVMTETQEQLARLSAVQEADGNINLVRAVGGLAGLGIGVAVGSAATYVGWRR